MSTPELGRDGPPASGAAAVAADGFEQAPTVLVAYDGPQFLIAAANAAGRAVLGHREPLLGVPAREALGELGGQRLFEVFERVYATGQQESARECPVPLDQDGDGGPEDHWFTFILSPWLRADGTIRGVLSHVTEVTDAVISRREAEGRARQAQQRPRGYDVAVELQRVLLPQGLPVLPQTRVDARYYVAGQEQSAGGDWFDAITLDDGLLALVVGDVVGHGITAAAVMGQLRAVLRQLLTSTALPEALQQLDRFARQLPEANGATLAVAVLDPSTGALDYATCGHPPLLVMDETGRCRTLPTTGAGPLGTARLIGSDGAGSGDSRPTPTRSDALAPGELILMYTDGLIEREGRSLAEGLAELRRVAADAAAGRDIAEGAPGPVVDRVAGITVELLTRAGYTDDVTVLVAQRLLAPIPDLHLEHPAVPATVRRARRALEDWLAVLGVDPGQARDLQLAVSEAVSNSVEHAYPRTAPGTVSVTGRVDDHGVLHLYVDDHGRWREPSPRPDGRGLGLAMMRHVLDTVQVEPRPGDGTRVRLSQRLTRPVLLSVDAPSTATPSWTGTTRTEFSVRVDQEPTLTVHVTGPVDTASGGELTAVLLNTSRGGNVPMAVDLSKVTLLGSAGVHALHTVRAQFVAQDRDLRLLAPPGTPGRQILDLVGLPATWPPSGTAKA